MGRIRTVHRKWRHGKDAETGWRDILGGVDSCREIDIYCKMSIEMTKQALRNPENMSHLSGAYSRIDDLSKRVKAKHYTVVEKERFEKALSEARHIVRLVERKKQKLKQKSVKETQDTQWQVAAANYHAGLSMPNHQKADDSMDLRTDASKIRVQSSVSIMLNKIAEDSTGFPYEGDDFWDIERLMQRHYTNAQLRHCKLDKDKEGIFFLVDTSPSCDSLAHAYSKLVSSVLERGDVTLIKAPNGTPMQYYDRGSKQWHHYNFHYESDIDDVELWKDLFRGRKVIFFGDTDGEHIVSKASRFCDVYWFYNESYEPLESYKYNRSYKEFQGKIYLCNDIADFLYCVSQVK